MSASETSLRPTVAAIVEQLVREGALAAGDEGRARAALVAHVPALPWYGRAVTGFFGWVAAMLFIEWTWSLHLGGEACVAAGLAAIAGGLAASRRWRRGYLAYLAIAVTLAGEGLATGGVSALSQHDATVVALFVLGVELALLYFFRDPMMRLMSALAAFAAVAHLWWLHRPLQGFDVPLLAALAGALAIFNARPRLARTRWRDLVTPVGYGLVLSACCLLAAALERRWTGVALGWPSRVGAALLLLAQLALVVVETRAPRWLLAVAVVGVGALAALSVGSPALLVALALIACAWHRREPGLVGAAAVFLAFFYYNLYSSLEQTLLFKARLLITSGALFLVAWLALGLGRRRARHEPVAWQRQALVGGALLVALLVTGGLVLQKEAVLTDGELLLLELRPRDPRSLMQGDYMVLRYRLPDQLAPAPLRDGQLIVGVEEDGVARFRRFDDGTPLGDGERRLRYRQRDGGLRLGAESYFFQEGDGPKFERARYGALRVTRGGESVLVGLRDAQRHPLGPELLARR